MRKRSKENFAPIDFPCYSTQESPECKSELFPKIVDENRKIENCNADLFNTNEISIVAINGVQYSIHKYILKKIHIMDAMLDGDISGTDIFEIDFNIKQKYVTSIIKSLYEKMYDMFDNTISIRDRIQIEKFMKYLAIDQENIDPVMNTMYRDTNIIDYIIDVRNISMCDEVVSGITRCEFVEKIVSQGDWDSVLIDRADYFNDNFVPAFTIQAATPPYMITPPRTPQSNDKNRFIETIIETMKDYPYEFKEAVIECFINKKCKVDRKDCDLMIGYLMDCDRTIAEAIRTGIQDGHNLAILSTGETKTRFVRKFLSQFEIIYDLDDFEIIFSDQFTVTGFIINGEKVLLIGDSKPHYKGVIGVNIYDTLIGHVRDILKKKIINE